MNILWSSQLDLDESYFLYCIIIDLGDIEHNLLGIGLEFSIESSKNGVMLQFFERCLVFTWVIFLLRVCYNILCLYPFFFWADTFSSVAIFFLPTSFELNTIHFYIKMMNWRGTNVTGSWAARNWKGCLQWAFFHHSSRRL